MTNLIGLKEILITGREWIVILATLIAKIIPFPSDNIAAIMVLILAFWLVNTFFGKSKFLIKLIGTGALFWLLWLW